MDAWNFNFTTALSDKIFSGENFAIVLLILDVFLNGFRIINCLVCPYFVLRLSQCSLLHVNLKILLCYLPIGFMTINFSQMISQCLRLLDQQVTVFWLIEQLSGALYIMAFVGCSFSMILILVERKLAVWKRADYERRGNAIGIVLLIGNVSEVHLFHRDIVDNK